MITYFDGDPRLFLNENGARLIFTGGQPAMDAGLENLALISLFTSSGWAGNDLFDDPNQQIGSDFEASTRQPITLSALNDIRNATERALDNKAFGKIDVDVFNPEGNRIDIEILIQPPGADIQKLIISKNGLLWQAQALSLNSRLET